MLVHTSGLLHKHGKICTNTNLESNGVQVGRFLVAGQPLMHGTCWRSLPVDVPSPDEYGEGFQVCKLIFLRSHLVFYH